MKHAFLVMAVLVGLLSVSCGGPEPAPTSPAPTPLRPKPLPAPDFQLINQFGQVTSLAQLKGKVVVLTFLYTHCADLCPLYENKIGQAVTELGSPAGDEVVLVAVTVDPERETVEAVREHTSKLPFDMLYLTGEPEQVKDVWDSYDIYVEKEEGGPVIKHGHPEHEGYGVIHSMKAVLIDREGFIRAELFGRDWEPEELAEKIKLLLAEK